MDAEVRAQLVRGGCVPSMLAVVRGRAELPPRMVRHAMLALGNLSAEPAGAAALLAAKGGVAAVAPSLGTDDAETARLAALVAANVAASGPAGRAALVDAGLLPPLLRLLRARDSLTARFAMGALREAAAHPAGRARVTAEVRGARVALALTDESEAALLRCLLAPAPHPPPPLPKHGRADSCTGAGGAEPPAAAPGGGAPGDSPSDDVSFSLSLSPDEPAGKGARGAGAGAGAAAMRL